MLDKAIEHGKEKRKTYYGAGRYDLTCRPNGGCPYCFDSRYHKHKKREISAREQIEEIEYDDE